MTRTLMIFFFKEADACIDDLFQPIRAEGRRGCNRL